MFVLRIKGEKRGHVFYEYLEEDPYRNIMFMDVGKLKYAELFDSEEDAVDFKNNHHGGQNFDVVPYEQASNEYI